jgi:hypothetical protein
VIDKGVEATTRESAQTTVVCAIPKKGRRQKSRIRAMGSDALAKPAGKVLESGTLKKPPRFPGAAHITNYIYNSTLETVFNIKTA